MKDIKDIRLEINSIDKELAILFEQRMKLVREVAEYKKYYNLPILDEKRELLVIENNLKNISNDEMKKYYTKFIKDIMDISKEYQLDLINNKEQKDW